MSSDRPDIKLSIRELAAIRRHLVDRRKWADPATYDLPDLLRRQRTAETDDDFVKWRREQLTDVITKRLKYEKDGEQHPILLIPTMLDFVYDLFYRVTPAGILWKSRGAGGSLMAAVVIWLSMVYHRMSWLNFAGAEAQSKAVYKYTTGFWKLFPGMSRELLKGKPLLRRTELKNGVQLRCVHKENEAVGQHDPGFCADEGATGDAAKDRALSRSMQGTQSEDNSMVILLSTMHHAHGLFVDVWDDYEKRGFKRYTWNVYDTMLPCTAGIEHATPDDPLAIESFCKKECFLCEEVDQLDDEGRITGREWIGCLGRARTSRGWMPRNRVIDIKKQNLGTEIFAVEFENRRLRMTGNIFNEKIIERAIVPTMLLDRNRKAVVGIDWGQGQCAMVLLGRWFKDKTNSDGMQLNVVNEGQPENGIGVIAARFLHNHLTEDVVVQIGEWQQMLGRDDISILADGSHNYNNAELQKTGLAVTPVYFGTYKERGYQNLGRWFARQGIRLRWDPLHPDPHMRLLIEQCKNLRRGGDGGVVKSRKTDETGDHGPDALMCAGLGWIFTRMYDAEGKLILDDLLKPTDGENDGTVLLL